MDEMVLSNRKYVTTKRAARVTGYAQDYVGQLIRSGKLKATKVGKAWFVAEDEVLRLAGKPSALSSPDRALAVLESKKVTETTFSVQVEYPKTWSPIHYFSDDQPLNPISDDRETIKSNSSIEILDVHRVRIARRGGGSVGEATESPVRYASFDGVKFESRAPHQLSTQARDDVHTQPNYAVLDEHTDLGEPMSDPRSAHESFTFASWLARIIASAIAVAALVFLIPIFG